MTAGARNVASDNMTAKVLKVPPMVVKKLAV
jgi:hypothetical protein